MPANNETRALKSNTLEELRQKSNEVSLHLGDNSLIDSRILDKTVSYTAAAGQTLFTGSGLRFEYKPEESIDDTSAGEAFNVGVLQVFLNGTELVQGIAAGQFKVPNFVGSITLSNISSAADVDEFVEDAVIYQGSSLATATWQGTVLDCTTTLLRLKTKTGTFSASTMIKVNGGTDTIVGANHGDINATDSAYGVMIELNTAASVNDVVKVVSTNVIDAVNEVQDDIGDITTLAAGIPSKSDVVVAVNSFKGEVGNAVDLTPSANTVVGAINEHETDIGDMSLTTTATDLTDAINEHDAELGTISSAAFGTTASTVSTAIAELHTDVDARLFLTSGSQQTLDSDVTFTNGNTLVFPAGSTLDIRNGLLQTGSGGLSVSTAFIDFNSDLDERGLSFERSDFGNGVDVKLIWDEVHAASQPDRGFRVIGLNIGATTETADLVTFYNAQDLIANNDETGINVEWDSTNQNFDFTLTADPTISLGGDLSGSVALTNLATDTFTLTATIDSGVVENSMLAGSISASKLAGGIGNSLLTNSGFELDADSGTTNTVNLGETLSILGTSGEIETSVSGNTLTVGLPSNVTVGNNLIVTGDLTVQGTNTILNTSTIEVEDTLVLAGSNLGSTEPSTGGFGLETLPFAGVHSNAAAGVTGAHSIVYNFATDRWEADGSLILSSATLATPQIEGANFGPGDNLTFTAGTGLSESVTGFAVTYNNTDRGSSQNIFKNVAGNSGGTATANSNNDTLTISGGSSLTSVRSGDTITLNHTSTGAGSVDNNGNTVIQDLTIDANGHVTAVGSAEIDTYSGWNLSVGGSDKGLITETERVSFLGGNAIDVVYTSSNNVITFNHADTSGAPNVDNSGTNFVQDMTFDAYGHVQTVTSAGFTLGNGTLTVQGTGVLGGTGTFTANQSTAGTISITHDAVSRSNTNSTASPGYGSTFTAIDSITTSNEGHITAVNTKTVTIPASDNTNTQLSVAQVRSYVESAGDSNVFTDADHTKLNNIASNATNTAAPAITTNGSLPSLASGITAAEVRSLIGAGTATVNDTGTPAILSNGSLNRAASSIRSDIGAGTSSLTIGTGAGNAMAGNTFIPTNNSQLSNGAGYTTYTANQTLNSSSNVHFEGLMVGQTSGSTANTIRCTGDVVAFYSSDERLKDNITPIENSLEKVGQLKGYEFDWNDNQEVYEGHDVGVIAQEVEKVVPEIVETRKHDGYKAVKYEKLVPLLINAINELKAEIEELKSINKKV